MWGNSFSVNYTIWGHVKSAMGSGSALINVWITPVSGFKNEFKEVVALVINCNHTT